MQKNSLLKKENQIIRVLEIQNEQIFIIDCIKKTMPKWVDTDSLCDYKEITEKEMQLLTGMVLPDMELLDAGSRRFMYEHYTLIAGILPFASDEWQRKELISKVSAEKGISKKSIRNYLCLYLAYQNIVALAPLSILLPKENKKSADRKLTQDEKNMRWSLNKYFYNQNKNSLNTAYTMMLKAKYCDTAGVLLQKYPTFNQFRYFYRRTKNLQNY